MPFPYDTVLITGATSGIGLALAERMIENGIFVIAVGRRKERLEALGTKHGAHRVAIEVFDVADLPALPEWVDRMTKTYPKISSIVLNAGHQRTVDFTSPSSISLPALTAETGLNYLSPLHTVSLFLSHLLSLAPRPTSIVLVSSGLSLVPIARCPNYCSTKAAVHSLAWTLRSQLGNPGFEAGRHLRIIELVPPAVQTELHSQQPDLVVAGQAKIGMPLDEYVNDTWAQLAGDDVVDEIVPAILKARFGTVEDEKRKAFEATEKMMRDMGNA